MSTVMKPFAFPLAKPLVLAVALALQACASTEPARGPVATSCSRLPNWRLRVARKDASSSARICLAFPGATVNTTA